ncbi:hypothetical protein V3F56_03205 [Moorellaceae bacterium AZ2]
MARVFSDRRASTFMEMSLWIILFVLALAPFVSNLAQALAGKFQELADRIGGLGI